MRDRCVSLLLLLPALLYATDFSGLLVERVRINAPSPLEMTITALLMIGAVVAVISYYLIRSRRLAGIYKERSEQVFSDTAKTLGLSTAEFDRIRHLAAFARGIEPQVIFQSISVWERCVDAYVREALTHRPSPAVKERENAYLYALREKLGFMTLPLEHPLASTRNLSIGLGGSVFPRGGHEQLLHKAHVSHMSEFSYVLHYNAEEEGSIRLRAGDEVRFAFMRPTDGFYSMPGTVLSFGNAGEIEISHSLDFKRNQLRQYVRLDMVAPLKFRLISTADESTSSIKRGEILEARFSDISGGGCSFITDRQLRPGDLVSVNFGLADNAFAGIAGKVLRVSLQEGTTKTFFKHHIQFSDMEQRKRDAIVRYVFEKQRQLNQAR